VEETAVNRDGNGSGAPDVGQGMVARSAADLHVSQLTLQKIVRIVWIGGDVQDSENADLVAPLVGGKRRALGSLASHQ